MERRHSTTSESSTDSRQRKWSGYYPCYIRCSSIDGLESGRMAKATTPKVAVNPLQFVKVGPCDLYRSAQEQLKKVEEIKKAKKERRDEAEDWQSNLDNWKCSRRKRQEHIIERVVEVKKLELEEHERNRRRSKTFNEMMQERNTRGRKSSLPVWNDDSDDLSDLGIGNKNDSSLELDRNHEVNGHSENSHDSSLSSELDRNVDNTPSENGNSTDPKEDSKSTESEEYTYDKAIQSYVNFAETRVKSKSLRSIDGDMRDYSKKESPPIPAKPKRGSLTKIDSYISQIELNKTKANCDATDSAKKPVAVPKVDVHKRRELFEKIKENEEHNKLNKTSSELSSAKSIKERLSSLEKHQENLDSSRTNIASSINTTTGVKDRLSNIEKISNSNFVPRRSSEPLSSQSIKDRLSSFEKSKSNSPKSHNVVEPTVSIKERLNSLHSSCEKEPTRTVIPSVDPTFDEKLSNFKESSTDGSYQNRSLSPDEIYNKREQHFRHRSLDSLDITQENMSNSSFERVQSLEDLDYRNYPASTFSGDTDREDSGIHTADVSSSVSQADDYDLHLDSNILDDIKMNHQPPIEEETKLIKNEDLLKNETCDISEKERNTEFKINSSIDNSENLENTTDIIAVTNTIQPFERKDQEVNVFKIDEPQTNGLYDSVENTNVSIVNQLSEIILESDPSCLFPLLPTSTLVPPKEKPPPPPTEISDDEGDPKVIKSKSLRRLDSTKRIKKEIRQKRSSFLGLEGNDDDSYLEPELELIRPPDMTTLLAEERRIERQLYRQSVCSESDSNQESRDSGVELDHKHPELTWSHSRNDSEISADVQTFGNQSTTSEEDEIMKKEREIIETLEQEEKIRKQDLGEKLAMRLRELEAEKERIEWEHLRPEPVRNAQPHIFPKHTHLSVEDLEKTRSREELKDTEWCTPRSSLQDISHMGPPELEYRGDYRKSMGDLTMPVNYHHQSKARYAAHRRSMPNLQENAPRRPPPPPPPVLPSKPLHLTQGLSQIVPQQVPNQHVSSQRLGSSQQVNGHHVVNPAVSAHNGNSQMSRQTLQALSAAPRSRLISADSWQVRKKQQRPPDSYNYQHWLIQEAEHRRITELQERYAGSRRPEVGRPEGRGWPTSTPPQQQWSQPNRGKPLPDSIIQTLTQRVQNRLSAQATDPTVPRRRPDIPNEVPYHLPPQNDSAKDKMLSVSGKKRCSHCGEELGRGAAMIIESLQLFYHIDCFKCCVCCIQLGDGLNGTDVRVRNNKLHCHNCYSSDDGAKFSCV
ncbi:LIM domain only protein 7 isoform X4 [Halyomorpha halys]|uniref:LIM domain only protein 7 isoform X4 n=1 Tax=Halyomorpha halys TaxID=286706 RepID=UPI0006D50589|nr:uncharacterized protein LOC106688948 isoform X3 [Halyomorpha halys]